MRRSVAAFAIGMCIAFCAQASSGPGPVAIGVNGRGPLAAQAHLGWARVSPYWWNMEPSRGSYSFGGLTAM